MARVASLTPSGGADLSSRMPLAIPEPTKLKGTVMLLPSTRSRRRAPFTAVTGLSVACAALVTACAPGAASSSSPPSQPASTAAGSAKATITVEEASIDVPLFQKLGALFTAKYPNITVNVAGQDFVLRGGPPIVCATR